MNALRRTAAAVATLGLGLSGLALAVAPAHADDTTGDTTGSTPTTDRLATLHLSDPTAEAALQKIVAALPQHSDPTSDAQGFATLTDDDSFDDLTNAAIDPSQYSCSSTPLLDWIEGQLGSDPSVLSALSQLGVTDYPTYYSIRFESGSQSQYLGAHGEYTAALTSEFTKLQGFWDIDGSKVDLVGMHSAFFNDDAKFAQFLQWYWGLDASTATALVPEFQTLIAAMPQGADNPLFTFNSFAYSGGDSDPSSPFYGVPSKVMIGDGIAEGLAAIGLDDVTAMEAVEGHEYGHQVQYADDLFDESTGPEASRRTELEADALGTYFMVHVRGEHLRKGDVLTDEQTFYQVGDCGYTSAAHHGTPNQRFRSAQWAADLAENTTPKGPAIPSRTFDQKFEQELPTIVAPDA